MRNSLSKFEFLSGVSRKPHTNPWQSHTGVVLCISTRYEQTMQTAIRKSCQMEMRNEASGFLEYGRIEQRDKVYI